MDMKVSLFLALADAMGELIRQDKLDRINTLIVAGQRGLKDQDYQRIVKDLGKRKKRGGKKLTAEEFAAFQARVEGLNRVCAELGL